MEFEKLEDVAFSILDEATRVRRIALKEYARSENVFENFEDTAARLGITREEVAYVFLDKHIRGIASYIRGNKSQRDSIRGRIVDAINYLLILASMFEDRNDAKSL